MFEIGSTLREARLRRGLALADVEARTRIRARYLAALEEEQFEILPGTAYAKGFLRTYADFLGLESQFFVDEFEARLAESEPPPEPPSQTLPLTLPSLRTWIPLGLGIALVAAGILAWRFAGSGGRPVLLTRATPPPSVASTSAPQGIASPSPAPTAETKRRPAPATLVLTASRGDCWLSVRVGSKAGRVLYEGLLQEGETVRVAGKRLWIRIGAPWNLDGRLDGKPVRNLPTTTGNVLVTSGGVRLL